MTDWIPEVAVLTPERQTILDLIKLCKKGMVYQRSVIQALNELANTGHPSLAIQFAEKVKSEEATHQRDVDVLFRRSESSLVHGEEYLQSLQAVLSKHLSTP